MEALIMLRFHRNISTICIFVCCILPGSSALQSATCPGVTPGDESRDLGPVVSGTEPVRVVAIGDFGLPDRKGRPDSDQTKVAKAIAVYHKQNPFDLGLTVGDNFYCSTPLFSVGCGGLSSPADPKLHALFEQPYSSLKIKFYATLGNHDYFSNWENEVCATKPNGLWQMPFQYYTFRAGPVQFFALDTALTSAASLKEMGEALKSAWANQLQWFERELEAKKDVKCKVAYGHRPVYSSGWEGGEPELQGAFLRLLKKYRVTYIAGHDHTLERIEKDGLQFFVTGGGGGFPRGAPPPFLGVFFFFSHHVLLVVFYYSRAP